MTELRLLSFGATRDGDMSLKVLDVKSNEVSVIVVEAQDIRRMNNWLELRLKVREANRNSGTLENSNRR